MVKHYTIPIFIPELACPFQCVFCNQRKISGHITIPGREEVIKIVKAHLGSFRQQPRRVEIAFFGGNFTGLDPDVQEDYLSWIQPYMLSGEVQGLRLSTRPDYIDEQRLELLQRYGVTTIELGAQSLDDEVLAKSYRGHTAAQTRRASEAILKYGFHLGLQMMIGLPGDSAHKAMETARGIVELGAVETRIYPTLVIRDTALHQWYNKGRYTPLSLEEAVHQAAQLVHHFELSKVIVLRTGLHPSEGLLTGKDLIAGPWHPNFSELVSTRLWAAVLDEHLAELPPGRVTITLPPGQLNHAIGFGALNKKWWADKGYTLRFREDGQLKDRQLRCEPEG